MYLYIFIYTILTSIGSKAAPGKEKPGFLCWYVCPWYCWDRRPKDDTSTNHLKDYESFDSKLTTLQSSHNWQNTHTENPLHSRWLFKHKKKTTTTTTEMSTTKRQDPPVYVIVVNVPIAPETTTTPKPTTQKVQDSIFVILVTPPTPTTTTVKTTTEKDDHSHWVCSACERECNRSE